MLNKETNSIRSAPIRGVDFNCRITNFHPTAPIRGVPRYAGFHCTKLFNQLEVTTVPIESNIEFDCNSQI